MESLVNRNELRRLEKAAREKDKIKLRDWALQYERTLSSFIQEGYEKMYQRELANGFDILLLSVFYSLLTNERVKIEEDDIELVIDDLHKVIDSFRSGEYKPEDYLDKLSKLGLTLSDYNYEHRITDIVAFVISKEYSDRRDKMLEILKNQQVIFLEMDSDKTQEVQIRKNIDMINMCTRMYYLGNSETIQAYITYANQIKKPVLEALFLLDKGDFDDVKYDS